MSYDYKSYINNSIIRDVVNDLVKNPGSTPEVIIDDRGRSWAIVESHKRFGTEEYGDVTSLLERIWCRVVLFFKCWSSTYRTNFNNAIKAINQASQKIQESAEVVEKVASPVLTPVASSDDEEEFEVPQVQHKQVKQDAQDITSAPPASVKTFDLATDLIDTGFAKINALAAEIKKQTGSVRLANVWARLLGKFGDIVFSYQVSKNVITINLKPVQGRPDDEQYRFWVPTSRNEEGVAEPEGGIILLLGKKIILEAEQKKLKVKGGYQNFVRVPNWARIFGEFSSAPTTQMREVGKDQIGIEVSKSILVKTITRERSTDHEKLDRNWKGKAEVIKDNRTNQKVIEAHDSDYIAD